MPAAPLGQRRAYVDPRACGSKEGACGATLRHDSSRALTRDTTDVIVRGLRSCADSLHPIGPKAGLWGLRAVSRSPQPKLPYSRSIWDHSMTPKEITFDLTKLPPLSSALRKT